MAVGEEPYVDPDFVNPGGFASGQVPTFYLARVPKRASEMAPSHPSTHLERGME